MRGVRGRVACAARGAAATPGALRRQERGMRGRSAGTWHCRGRGGRQDRQRRTQERRRRPQRRQQQQRRRRPRQAPWRRLRQERGRQAARAHRHSFVLEAAGLQEGDEAAGDEVGSCRGEGHLLARGACRQAVVGAGAGAGAAQACVCGGGHRSPCSTRTACHGERERHAPALCRLLCTAHLAGRRHGCHCRSAGVSWLCPRPAGSARRTGWAGRSALACCVPGEVPGGSSWKGLRGAQTHGQHQRQPCNDARPCRGHAGECRGAGARPGQPRTRAASVTVSRRYSVS